MKKILSVILAVALCVALAAPVFGASFVPSISFKLAPSVVSAILNGEEVGPCITVTSIIEAEEKSTDITQDARDLLLSVYEKLDEGTMSLPVDGVIVHLVDVSFAKTACVDAGHGHEAELGKEDVNITVTFDLGAAADEEIAVLSYDGSAWENVVSVKNNGDGTVTCEMAHFCPVAFVTTEGGSADVTDPDAPGTGDNVNLALWAGLLVASAAVLAVGVVNRRKIFG